MEIFIENNKVKFMQGVQTFTIDYEGNEEELKWMAEQLDTCFKKFMHEIKMETINEMNSKMIQKLVYPKDEVSGKICPLCLNTGSYSFSTFGGHITETHKCNCGH